MVFNEFIYNLVLDEIFVSLVGFFSTLFLIPIIVTLAWKYNLLYFPNSRTSHVRPIPAIGGVAMFIGFLISGVFLAGFHTSDFHYIVGGITFIFLIGIIDDIITLSATKKLSLVLLIALITAISGGIRLTSLHFFLGFDVLPYWLSIFLSVGLMTYVINAINLIDGIDGNAAITGIYSLVIFSALFLRLGYLNIISIAIPIILVYSAFFIFNFWGKRYKIFMGDTGSLVLGFVLAVTIIKFCNLNAGPVYYSRLYSPLTVFSILIVPLFDQLHVFIKRMMMGKSPFQADRNHLHHTWLKLGFTHRKTAFILLGYNLFFFLVNTFILLYLPVILHLLILFVLALVFWHVPEQYLKHHSRMFVTRRFNYKKKQMRNAWHSSPAFTFKFLRDITH